MISNVEEVLKSTGVAISGFSGTSMMPMLRQGKDKVVISALDRPLKLHDVPLYKSGDNKYVLHRIIKVKPDGYVIRGDNLYNNECNVTDENIIGVLTGFYRGEKYIDLNGKGYKFYVFYVRVSYPLRWLLFNFLKPKLWALKQKLLGKSKHK